MKLNVKMKPFIQAALIAATVTGCGKSAAPLNDAQTKRLATFLKGSNESYSSIKQTQSAKLAVGPVAFSHQNASATIGAQDPNKDLMAALEHCDFGGDALAASPFSFEGVGLESLDLSDSKESKIQKKNTEVKKDDRCPLELSSSSTLDFNAQARSMKFTMTSHFGISNPEVQKLAEIASMDFKLEGSGTMSEDGTSGSASMKAEAQVQSKTEGAVKLAANTNGSGNSDGGSLTTVMNLSFKDFSAELKMIETTDKNGNDTTTYYLNGVKKTEAQLEKLFAGEVVGDETTGNKAPTQTDKPSTEDDQPSDGEDIPGETTSIPSIPSNPFPSNPTIEN